METSETLSLFAGGLLSLAFSYIPKLNTWYASKDEQTKQLVMLAALLITTLGIFGASCARLYEIPFVGGVECSQSGAVSLGVDFVIALIANQGVHRLSPRTQSVKMAWKK